MKRIVVALLSCAICLTSSAQCENAYFPFDDGVTYELTSYKPNGKETGKTKSSIASTDKSNTVIVKNEIYDKKGKLLNEGEFEVTCENGTVKVDMEKFIPQEIHDNYENMEMTMEGDFLEFPSDLEVGQTLPDGAGTLTIKMGSGGVDMNMKMNVTFKNRKVEKKETVETPAGTYDTYKITQTTDIHTEMMGMNRTISTSSASWLSESVGTVRSENYDKNGKLESYSVLTSLTR